MLFIDTETTGKVNGKLPAVDNAQPHIMQLGLLAYTDTRKVAEFELLLKPLHYKESDIAPEAIEVHGITYDDCRLYGVTDYTALHFFTQLYLAADTVIAHGWGHEDLVLRKWYYTNGVANPPLRPSKHYCTMLEFSKHFKLPGARWNKWPKLSEMYKFFHGSEFPNAHTALADAKATAACYYSMQQALTPAVTE